MDDLGVIKTIDHCCSLLSIKFSKLDVLLDVEENIDNDNSIRKRNANFTEFWDYSIYIGSIRNSIHRGQFKLSTAKGPIPTVLFHLLRFTIHHVISYDFLYYDYTEIYNLVYCFHMVRKRFIENFGWLSIHDTKCCSPFCDSQVEVKCEYICDRCGLAMYCTLNCQEKHYFQHQRICKLLCDAKSKSLLPLVAEKMNRLVMPVPDKEIIKIVTTLSKDRTTLVTRFFTVDVEINPDLVIECHEEHLNVEDAKSCIMCRYGIFKSVESFISKFIDGEYLIPLVMKYYY